MTRSMVESVGHFYFLPIGSRTKVGLREYCEACGSSYLVDDDPTIPLESSRWLDVDTLISSTNPDVERTHAVQLSLADRSRSRQASPAERRKALSDALICADVLMSDRAGGFQLDLVSSISLGSTVGVPAVIMAWAEANVGRVDLEQAELAAAGAILFFVFTTIWCVATDARRYFRGKVLPVLARSLAPLDPSADEIDQAISELGSDHDVIGRFATGFRLREEIDRVR